MSRIVLLLSGVFMFFSVQANAQDETRLLRFPAIHDDHVVFTYAGDLYTVSSSGGVARRMTADIGYEMFARFSPDGKEIAFTGQYDGNTEVYLMSAEGGVPRRLTVTATLGRDDVSDRMGPNNIVTFDPASPPPRRVLLVLSRRQEHGLQPRLPGIPHVETVPGRTG
jgi:tricorn protease